MCAGNTKSPQKKHNYPARVPPYKYFIATPMPIKNFINTRLKIFFREKQKNTPLYLSKVSQEQQLTEGSS